MILSWIKSRLESGDSGPQTSSSSPIASPASISSSSSSSPPTAPNDQSNFRATKQFLVFAASATFFLYVTRLTQRAVARTFRRARRDHFFEPSHGLLRSSEVATADTSVGTERAARKVSSSSPTATKASILSSSSSSASAAKSASGGHGPSVAVEALSLATLNVVGVAMVGMSGLAWAMDVGSWEEARLRLRARMWASARKRKWSTEQSAETETPTDGSWGEDEKEVVAFMESILENLGQLPADSSKDDNSAEASQGRPSSS